MQVLILFSCLLAAASAWNCPNLPVVEQLDVTKLTGTWYQQGLAGAAFFTQPGGSCAKAEYTADSTGKSLFTIKNTQKQIWGSTAEVDGWANWANPSEQNGKLTITIKTILFNQSADLWVLDTDYDNFLILFSCKKVLGLPAQASWVLRREQNPTGDAKTQLDALIQAAFDKIAAAGGPDISDFVETDQTKC